MILVSREEYCKGPPVKELSFPNAMQSRSCANWWKGFTYNEKTRNCEPFSKMGCFELTLNGFESYDLCLSICIILERRSEGNKKGKKYFYSTIDLLILKYIA